jgi:hypothetical protein
MQKSRLFIAIPLALALSVGAVAGDKSHKHSMSDSDAVAKVKGTLTNINGFEVEDVRTGDGGVACVTYHVTNDANGLSQARAVVDGDQVLHEVNGSARFEKAWNGKCAGK